MLKAILASVVLSTGLTVGLLHEVPQVQESIKIHDYAKLRGEVWRMDITFNDEHNVEQTMGFCSAVAIKPNLLLTAAHCDLASDEQFAMYGPTSYKLSVAGHPYTIVKKDVDKDLMLVYVDGFNSSVAQFKDLVPGSDHKVVAVGFPMGLVNFITEGRIQDVAELPPIVKENLGHELPKFLAASTPITGGNSGGGLFVKYNGAYYLIGICSMGGGDVALFIHPDVIASFIQ